MNPDSPQLIDSPIDNALGVLLISNGLFFDHVVTTYRANSDERSCNYVECTTNRLLSNLANHLKAHGSSHISVHNLDTPPFLHSQTLGYLAGIAEYIPGNDIKLDLSQMGITGICSQGGDHKRESDPKVLGLTLHPKYGGWFAYRGLLVFDHVKWCDEDQKPKPLRFLSDDQRRDAIIEFNVYPDLGYWRDFNDRSRGPVLRYSPIQFAYYHEKSSRRRRRILELLDEERDRTQLPYENTFTTGYS